MKWITVILLVTPLLQRLALDYFTIMVDKIPVDHKKHTILTGVLMVACAGIIQIIDGTAWWRALIMSWGLFFLCFDYLLNVIRGLKWYYVPYPGPGVSKWDGMAYKIGPWGVLFIKFFLFMVAVAVYLDYHGEG